MAWNDINADDIVDNMILQNNEWISQREFPNAFRINELSFDAQSYNAEADWQNRRWGKILCINHVGDNYPIPIVVRKFFLFQNRKRTGFRNNSKYDVKYALESMNFKIFEANKNESDNFFRFNMIDFIKTRIRAFNNNFDSNFIKSGTLPFTVHTQGRNLRVLYSPSYSFGFGDVFGYPSTPVSSNILPGSYIFGAEGINSNSAWESNRIYNVPNDKSATLITI